MKIVCQIEKLDGGRYQMDGKVFDSFLSARRAMAEWKKKWREERRNRRAAMMIHQRESMSA